MTRSKQAEEKPEICWNMKIKIWMSSLF